jgi:hypothetical protein
MTLHSVNGSGISPIVEPNWKILTKFLIAQAGTLIQAIYPDGVILESGGAALGWGSSVPQGSALVNASASLFTTGYDSAGGFRYIHGAGESTKQLIAPVSGGTTYEVWLVCRPAVLPFTSYRGAVQTTSTAASATRFLVGDNAQSTWFAPLNGTCFRDGTASTSAATGWHVYKRYSDIAAANNGVSVGNDVGGLAARSWQGDIAFVMLLNGQTNPTQQSAIFSELISYHKVTP